MVENWKTDDVALAEGNLIACAYNAAVNSNVPRGIRKMGDLIRAINYYERVVGFAKLAYLKKMGIISNFSPCPVGCEMRPGGLFHVKDCENEGNSIVHRERRIKAEGELPGKEAGYWVATVSLVGATSRG